MRKVQRWWGMVAKLLAKTGATVREHAIMYKTVVQTVLLYRSKSWVVTEAMLMMLEGFQNWVAQRIVGMSSQQVGEEVWEWSLSANELEAAGMWPTKEYIRRWQANILEYITNHSIYEL